MDDYGYSSFYPSDLLDEYKNLWVRAGSLLFDVSVNKYRCSVKAFGGTADAELVKDGFYSIQGGLIAKEAGGNQRYVDVFTGKGSPNAIVTVLQLVHEYRLAYIKKFKGQGGVKGECATLLAKHEADPQAMLQAFCDAYIGLDCNGFVGNFIKRKQNSWIGPQTDIATLRRQGKTRRSVDDTMDMDVLIFPNNVHVAIIDTFEDNVTVNIAQSTGGGPQMTKHKLVPAGKNSAGAPVFNFDPPTKTAGPVQIVSFGL